MQCCVGGSNEWFLDQAQSTEQRVTFDLLTSSKEIELVKHGIAERTIK